MDEQGEQGVISEEEGSGEEPSSHQEEDNGEDHGPQESNQQDTDPNNEEEDSRQLHNQDSQHQLTYDDPYHAPSFAAPHNHNSLPSPPMPPPHWASPNPYGLSPHPPGLFAPQFPAHVPQPQHPPPFYGAANVSGTNPQNPQQVFAAGAAWAAAQIAQAAADYAGAAGIGPPPPPPGPFGTPWHMTGPHHHHQQPTPPRPTPPFACPYYSYPPPHPPPLHDAVPGGPGEHHHYANSDQHSHQSHPSGSAQARSRPSDQQDEDQLPTQDHLNDLVDPQHHRRKRQQRLPPPQEDESVHSRNRDSKPPAARFPEREKIRRRLRSDGESSSSGSSFYPNYHGGAGSNLQNSSSRRRYSKKKKGRCSDDSLLGKTAVSALYEWCSKRQRTPVFVQVVSAPEGQGADAAGQEQDFDFTVALNDEEDVPLGRGRGSTKSAAKQLAARRALTSLVPGVVFDNATGILVHLPNQHLSQSQSPSHQHQSGRNKMRRTVFEMAADDLAPDLAKQLAIDGRENQKHPPEASAAAEGVAEAVDTSCTKKRCAASPQDSLNAALNKRTLDDGAYPSAATTTSGGEDNEEDSNAYYLGRGASVCSALLHAMVQIDPRIPEAPQYLFQGSANQQQQQGSTEFSAEQKADDSSAVSASHNTREPRNLIRVHRGPFSCTARLKLQVNEEENARADKPSTSETTEGDESKASKTAPPPPQEILEAVGVGATKREARHVASAQLLARLFPECNTMMEVKVAAEEARELYAASKASSKQAHQQQRSSASPVKNTNEQIGTKGAQAGALCAVGSDRTAPCFLDDSEPNPPIGEPAVADDSGIVAQEASRQKQIEAQVNSALHALNEQDEEGRLLPAGREITEDDVGRTVLRRATEEEDLASIEKLLLSSNSKATKCSEGDEDALKSSDVLLTVRRYLNSPSSIVLLLCRAIAVYDDPPLGCAILSMGFSVEAGRLLRVAHIANEPHLPQERFLECLGDFARCMKCSLVTRSNESECGENLTNQKELRSASEAVSASHPEEHSRNDLPTLARRKPGLSSPLQSVKEEESEVSDASNVEKRDATNRASKPSKRTRVE